MDVTYFNYEWDYWELYHKVTFDGPNKLILINEGETNVNVLNDIYSAWKEWIQHDETQFFNARFEQAMTVVGGEPTVSPESLDATFFLINGWRLKPYSGNYRLLIDGNLFTDTGDPIDIPADGDNNNININTNTSVIVRRLGTLAESTDTTKIDEIWKIHGLDSDNPMTVDDTSRNAGDIDQSITGTNPTTVTRNP